jgi:hypothetical protein
VKEPGPVPGRQPCHRIRVIRNWKMSEKLSRQTWRIASFSSEEANDACGRATAIIDGNMTTFWHSRWTSDEATFPHFLVIDLGAVQDVHRFSVTQRRYLCRAVKDIDLLMSIDGNEFTYIDSYVLENADGTQIFDFIKTITMRFLKIVANSSWDGECYAALADLSLYRNKSGFAFSVSGVME